ncbi:MAG: TM2 domain-containing protein [Elusimicrobiaceae bacterium]|nr:TM2 domain-containing protein [Elusimicrobiaceae bacterium]
MQESNICPQCGAQKNSLNTIGTDLSTGKKNKWIAIFLAFFIGGFGAHKFYLGRTSLGVLYLLFCWTGIPFIIGIVEAVIYLTMSDMEFTAKYGVRN